MTATLPPRFKNLPAEFQQFKAAYRHAASVASTLRETSDRQSARDGEVGVWTWDPTTGQSNRYDAICERMADVLCWHAEKTLSAPGTRLEIASHPILSCFRTERENDRYIEGTRYNYVDDFGPEMIWAEIIKRFGGDVGRNTSLRAAASRLRVELGLGDGAAMKIVAGRVELSIRVYSEKAPAGFRLTYGTSEELYKTFSALVAICQNDPDAPAVSNHQLLAIPRQLSEYRGMSSRAHFGCGAVDVICFSQKIVLRLTKTFAERLNIFITEHAHKAEPALAA